MDGDLETAQFFYEKARKAGDADTRVGLATQRAAEGKRLLIVATDSDRQVDGQLDRYSQQRRAETGPIELTPRGVTAGGDSTVSPEKPSSQKYKPGAAPTVRSLNNFDKDTAHMTKPVTKTLPHQSMSLLSRLLLASPVDDDSSSPVMAELKLEVRNISRDEFNELVKLANSNHVIVRSMEAFLDMMHEAKTTFAPRGRRRPWRLSRHVLPRL